VLKAADDTKGIARLVRWASSAPSHVGTPGLAQVSRDEVKLPKRSGNRAYDDKASLKGMKFVAERYW